MQLEEATEDGVAVLSLSGRLDAMTVPSIEQQLLQAAAHRRPGLVLDLSGLDYTSSAGLRLLLRTAKQARAAGVRIALAALRPTVGEVLAVSGFSSIIDSYPTRAEAVEAVG